MPQFYTPAEKYGYYGIIIVAFAVDSVGPGAVIERSENGVTGWEEVAFLPSVEANGNHWIDRLPNDGVTRFYRARHVWDVGEPGPYTNIIAGEPIWIDPTIDFDRKPWPSQVPLTLEMDIDGDGNLFLFVDGSFRSKSIQWAVNVDSSNLPDVDSGTVYDFDPQEDPVDEDNNTVGITTIDTEIQLEDGELARAGVRFFTEPDAEGRTLGTHYDLARYVVGDSKKGEPDFTTRLEYFDDNGDPFVRVILDIDDPHETLDRVEYFWSEGPVSAIPDVSEYDPWTPESSGAYEGSYIQEVELNEKHLGVLALAGYWLDFDNVERKTQKVLWLNIDDEATIIDTDVSFDGTQATIRVKGDADTRELHAEQEIGGVWTSVESPSDRFDDENEDFQGEWADDVVYTEDQRVLYEGNTWIWRDEDPSPLDTPPPGSSWEYATRFSDSRRGEFTITASTEESLLFRVWGRNAAGDDGTKEEVRVSRLDDPEVDNNLIRVTDYFWGLEGDPTQQVEMDVEIGGLTESVEVWYQYSTPSEPNRVVTYVFNTPPSEPRTFQHVLKDGSFTSGQGYVTPLELGPDDTINDNRIIMRAYTGPNATGDMVEREIPLRAWGQGLQTRYRVGSSDVFLSTTELGSGLSLSGNVLSADTPTPEDPIEVEGGDGITVLDITDGVEVSVDNTVARTSRNINTGDGLEGGGNLSQDRNLSVDSTVIRTSRNINTGAGLQGGGNLSQDRTLSVDSSVIRTTGNQSMAGVKSFTGRVALGSLNTTRVAGSFYGGTTNPTSSTRLNYDGHFFATQVQSAGSFRFSDRALKKDIKVWSPEDLLSRLQPVSWTWKDSGDHGIGFVYQDTPEAFQAPSGKAINFDAITTALVATVKDLKQEIQELRDELEQLKQ